jgi:chemotaxis protein MotA
VRKPASRRFDLTSLVGAPLGIGLVVIGLMVEGGHPGMLLQPAAALVVLGGTLGAVLLSFSRQDLRHAVRSLRSAFVETMEPVDTVIGRIVTYANRARRSGMLALEQPLDAEPDPFLRRALTMAVDGVSPVQIRQMMELEIEMSADHDDVPARVFEAAGGYAPTIGIIGAVLGLIRVMEQLSDPSQVGPGIAVAFVATIYGVGSANLVLLPIATKLRHRSEAVLRRRELLLEGVLALQEGQNPRLIEQRLRGFTPGRPVTPPLRPTIGPVTASRGRS